MKVRKVIFSVFLMVSCTHLNSQTLTCENMCPKGVELYSVRICSPVVHTTGKNQLWDFSKPVAAGPPSAVTYLPAHAVPASSLYPQADIVRSQSYGDFSGTVFLQTGTNGVELAAASNATVNAQLMVLPMPFTMGSTHTETNVTKYMEGLDIMELTRTRSLSGVGTGTVILPSGTFNDVVRIACSITERITRNGVQQGAKLYANINYYYSEKIPHPLVYSENKWEDGQVDYGPITIFISDIPVSIREIKAKLSVPVCGPNPASETVQVTLPGGNAGWVKVVDVTGKTMLSDETRSGSLQLNVNGLPEGIYTVQTITNDGIQHTRLLVSRQH